MSGRNKIPEDQRRNKPVQFRLTAAERALLNDRALASGYPSLSSWLRALALGQIKEDATPAKPPADDVPI